MEQLGFDFGFAELATREGLVRLDRLFLERLAGDDAALHGRLMAARAEPDAVAQAELTPTQFTALLKVVQLGRTTQNLLGRHAAMDPATIQGVVRRLIGRGLVHRGRDPMDRRTAVLEATPAGVALITRVVASARGAHDAALAPLSPEERAQVMALLRKMG